MRTPRLLVSRRPLAFWTMAGLALLLSHNAVYLVQVGPGEPLAAAMRNAGHGYWDAASAVLAFVGCAAIAVALVRIRSLRRRASALSAHPTQGPAGLGRRWFGGWVRLLAAVAVGFLVQENVEHFIGHDHALGLRALAGPDYPLALPVIGLITAVAALALATFRQVEHVLLVSIATALRRATVRAPRTVLRPPLRLPVPATSPMAGASAGRAPPRSLVSVV